VEISFCFVFLVFLPSGFFFITHYRYSESRNGNAFPLFSFAVARWRCCRNHDLSWLASWISTVFVVVVAAIVVVVVCATAAVVLSPWTWRRLCRCLLLRAAHVFPQIAQEWAIIAIGCGKVWSCVVWVVHDSNLNLGPDNFEISC